MSKQNKEKTTYKRIIKALWIFFLIGIIGLPLYLMSVKGNWLNLYGGMPDLKELENPKSQLSSEIISADGVVLGRYFVENRTPVDYDELSSNLVNALKATEDIRFESHSGIDLKALVRVLKGIVTFDRAGGGSTLTQQLAKNLFGTRTEKYEGLLSNVPGIRTMIQKNKEWILATMLERAYTKPEILAMYLNAVSYGSNAFGIKTAAETFFDTSQDSLNIQQAAVLVGVLKAPSFFNPVRNPENSKSRRNVVLAQMKKYEYLTEQEFDSLKILPLDVVENVQNQNQGSATYFRKVAGNFLRKWADENGYNLYRDGLKIYTTIDSRMQAYAEQAVKEHLKSKQNDFFKHWEGRNPWRDEKGKEIPNFLENAAKRTDHYRALVKKYGADNDSIGIVMNIKRKMKIFAWSGEVDSLMSPMDSIRYYKHFLQTGFMAMDPHNGHIKAWVGGINHKYFKYDHVYQGKRQPGSTFKPFVYATAISLGYSPCMRLPDAPVTFSMPQGQEPYSPPNSDGKYTNEMLTIREAMARSINSVTALVMKKVSPAEVVKYAHNIGIKSKLDAVPSLCLGTSDVSLFELVGAYGTFVNEGTWTMPIYVTKIEDKNGNVLKDFAPTTVEALNEETAYVMLHMLKGATQVSGGTATGLNRELRHSMDIGAKTGTTNNASDGWFMGITKDLVAGAWVGGDDRSIHFRNWTQGQGARTAMPIWEKFMIKVYGDKKLGYEKGQFKRPRRRLSIELDCARYNELNFLDSDSASVDDSLMKIDDIL